MMILKRAAIGSTVALLALYAWGFALRTPIGIDGAVYIHAAGAVRAGQSPLVPGYLYPPLLAVLLQSFTLSAWMIGIVLANALLILLLRPYVGVPVALVAVLAFAPAVWSSWWGNVNIWIAVLYLHALRQRPGVWLSIGAAIKIVPGVGVLVLLVKGQWKHATLTALCLFLLWPFPADWLDGMRHALSAPVDIANSTSWTALLERLGWNTAGIVLSVAVLLVTLWRARSLPLPLALAAAMVAPLLVARVTWSVHAVMLLPVFAVLWERHRRVVVLSWIGLALPSFIPAQMALIVTLLWLTALTPNRLVRVSSHPYPARQPSTAAPQAMPAPVPPLDR